MERNIFKIYTPKLNNNRLTFKLVIDKGTYKFVDCKFIGIDKVDYYVSFGNSENNTNMETFVFDEILMNKIKKIEQVNVSYYKIGDKITINKKDEIEVCITFNKKQDEIEDVPYIMLFFDKMVCELFNDLWEMTMDESIECKFSQETCNLIKEKVEKLLEDFLIGLLIDEIKNNN